MSWFWTIFLLTLAITNSSEAKHQKKLPSAVVIGKVYCQTCFQQNSPKTSSHFIAGASVAVECKNTSSRPSFRQEVKTDDHGEFKVHLPFSVSKHAKKIRGCSVKLISSNEPYCTVAATAASSSLHLKARKEGTNIFSAGFFTFKPLKQPELCDQKPSINDIKKLINSEKLTPTTNPSDPTFVPPALGSSLPPLPQVPRLPPLPRIPFLPPKHKKETAAKSSQLSDKTVNQPNFLLFPPNPFNPFPPNPFQPPPSILPPNPFQPPPSIIPPLFPSPPPSIFPPLLPSPPPSIFPPLFPSPPSPPLFHLPPIPGLTPSPPPPPPPLWFRIPLPPFPFQPTPGFPGVPPAKVPSPSKTTSP